MSDEPYIKTIIENTFILWLSGVAKMRNDNEVWTTNEAGEKITIEFVNKSSDNIILRGFYEDGNIRFENKFKLSEQTSWRLTGTHVSYNMLNEIKSCEKYKDGHHIE